MLENFDSEIEFSENEIQSRIKEMGNEICKDYADKNLLIVPLLNGAFIFAADLVRAIKTKLSIEFLNTKSYGNELETLGKVDITDSIERDLSDFDVLIVDDIIDSGYTLKKVSEYIASKNPKSIKTCAFLNKPERREVDIEADYCGFDVKNNFIVGYGLNYGDYYRNIPYIFSIKEKK